MNDYPVTKLHVFGRAPETDVQLDGLEISRQHFSIERVSDTFLVKDLQSRSGTLVNGRHVLEHQLVYGDVVSAGRHNFRFDGHGLSKLLAANGASVTASTVIKDAGVKRILHGINLDIQPGEFVGILGTSGAGKSTLLDILSGIRAPTSGQVTISGLPVQTYLVSGPAVCGYVPQADIVHFELTVRQAIQFAALLRLPPDASQQVIAKCVEATMNRLEITKLADVTVAQISGGQRKRVSVAVEILSRPALLFLDEPSSGLDPATEFRLMSLLRDLANIGCTIVCTTHVMDNVHVFDRLVILRDGQLIFTGLPDDAKSHFGIDRFVKLYERIESRHVSHWVSSFKSSRPPHSSDPAPAEKADRPPSRASKNFLILLHRQILLLFSDLKSPLFLVGQPLLIGSLVAWMAEANGFKLFIAHLATFWFGCSNGSQEIVKEVGIYCRERLVGVSRAQYLGAKSIFWIVVTFAQAAVMYTALHLGPKTLLGEMRWQMVCLATTAMTGVAFGFAVSAWVKTAAQASMIVPLILLPQVILSGFVLPPVKDQGVKRFISRFAPSYSSQFLMDTSLLWNTKLGLPNSADAHDFHPAYEDVTNEAELSPGEIYDDDNFARAHVRRLLYWTLAAFVLVWAGLRKRETT